MGDNIRKTSLDKYHAIYERQYAISEYAKKKKMKTKITEQGFTFYWEREGMKVSQRAMEVLCLTLACQTCNLPTT